MNSILGVIAIFILSRAVLRHMFIFLHRFTRSQTLGISIISILYFPGTVIHEMSHFIVALILNMHPRDVSLFPVIDGRRVRLGHVEYEREKGDFIRPILVGVAPLFGASVVLWLLVQTNLLYETHLGIRLLVGYFILSVTANMFSSDQDLKYFGYIIPIGLVLAFIYYIIPFNIHPAIMTFTINTFTSYLATIEPAILFSAVTHAILLGIFIIVNKRII